MTDNRTTERVDHPPRVREAIDELMREKDANDNRTTELLPCPFCGGEAAMKHVTQIWEPKESYWAACQNCHMSGKHYRTEAEAIKAWNSRAERTCHDEGDPSDFCCSECGARMFTDVNDTYTMIANDEQTIIKHPNYCPNCGRKVVVS